LDNLSRSKIYTTILAAKVAFEQKEILDITRLQSELVMFCLLCILKVHVAFVKWNIDADTTQRDFDSFESYLESYPCIKTSKLRTRLKNNPTYNFPLKGLFYITVKRIEQTS